VSRNVERWHSTSRVRGLELSPALLEGVVGTPNFLTRMNFPPVQLASC